MQKRINCIITGHLFSDKLKVFQLSPYRNVIIINLTILIYATCIKDLILHFASMRILTFAIQSGVVSKGEKAKNELTQVMAAVAINILVQNKSFKLQFLISGPN